MLKKITALVLVGAAALTVAWAGDEMAKGKMDHPMDMAAMKADMMKCMVCKNMAPHLEEIMPVMRTEVAPMNNGSAVLFHISDPKMLATYHSTCEMMNDAGMKAMDLPADQAKTQLCQMCQQVYAFSHAGGSFSIGNTKDGDLMVFSSDKPELQKQATELANMYGMMGQHE